VNICKALINSPVHTLKVSKNKLTDKCCEPLAAALCHNHHLTSLILTGNNIQSKIAKNKLKNGVG